MYILSRLANDQVYIKYKKGYGNKNIVEKEILIKGKADITTRQLITPMGVLTKVSDDDFEILKENPCFKEHCERGYISYYKIKPDIEKSAQKLNKDESAPLDNEKIEKLAKKRNKKAPNINAE